MTEIPQQYTLQMHEVYAELKVLEKVRQHLLYFIYEKTHVVLFYFSFHASLLLPFECSGLC